MMSKHVTCMPYAYHKVVWYTSYIFVYFFIRDDYDSDASDVSDDNAQPFTKDQLMTKAMRSVSTCTPKLYTWVEYG